MAASAASSCPSAVTLVCSPVSVLLSCLVAAAASLDRYALAKAWAQAAASAPDGMWQAMARSAELAGTVTLTFLLSCDGVSVLCKVFPAVAAVLTDCTTCAWLSMLMLPPLVRLPETGAELAAFAWTDTVAVAV